MAGPFACHGLAVDAVEATKAEACENLDLGGRAWFAAWGTARVRPEGEDPGSRGSVRRRLAVFVPEPSEGGFYVFARGSGHLRCVKRGAPHPGSGWTQIAKVTMPRREIPGREWSAYVEACNALYRVYRGAL
jgi:hypothetical protein